MPFFLDLDRLRKPPFRFLFDVAAEIARTTGFGLTELFGGELNEKPTAPSSKEEKLAFLEKWLDAVKASGAYLCPICFNGSIPPPSSKHELGFVVCCSAGYPTPLNAWTV